MKFFVSRACLFLMVLYCLLSSATCSKISNDINTITLAQEETKSITMSGKSIKIKNTGIADSRCPQGVQCVWAGTATVTLVVSETNKAPQIITLCIGACTQTRQQNRHVAEIGNIAVAFTLKDITPYPAANATPAITKKAVILTELGI